MTKAKLPDLIDGLPARKAAEALAAKCETAYDAFAATAQTHPDLPFLCIPARQERDYHPNGFEISYGAALLEVARRIERLRAGVAKNREIAQDIFNSAKALLAYYKLPGWVAFVDDLSRTGTQKVRKGLIFPNTDDPREAPNVIDLRDQKKRSTL